MTGRLAQAALAAFASVALVAVLVAVATSSGSPGAAELEQRRADAALSQLLAARREQGAGYHQNGKELARARIAMRVLEHSLQGELSSVKEVLAQLHRKPAGITTLHEGDAAWQRRTMQRGALQGESTEKQLTRVLQKELSEKIHKKLKWSTTDLQNAAGFAEYLKQHPLPTSRSKSTSRLEAGNDAGDDSVTSKRLDDGVIKVTFKREMTMTDKQYREMEDAMQDSYSKEDEPVADAGKSTNTARLSKIFREATHKGSRQPSQAPRLRKIFRAEDAPTIGGGSRSSPVTESQRYAENVLDWHQTPLQDNYVAAHARARTHTHTDRTPEMSTVPRSQGEEVKDILEKVLGVAHRDSRDSRRPMSATSPLPSSLAAGRHSKAGSGLLNEAKHSEFVPEEASKHVKYTSGDAVSLLAQQRAKLSAREHGEFVHLPPRHEMVPRSVQPYYWKTLPATARAEVQSEHHQ